MVVAKEAVVGVKAKVTEMYVPNELGLRTEPSTDRHTIIVDLRQTYATKLMEYILFAGSVVSELLNHVNRSFDRAMYDGEFNVLK